MSIATEQLGQTPGTDVSAGLRRFASLPDWLSAIADPTRVRDALARGIPEFASGALILHACEVKRVRSKKDRWTAMYRLTVAEPDSGEREITGFDSGKSPERTVRGIPR